MPEFIIKRAWEINRPGRGRWILATCPKCKAERYVFLRNLNLAGIAASQHCKDCNPRSRGRDSV